MMGSAETRENIVREATSWLGSPYHHEARVKGHGVDCGMLILEVFEKVGLLPHIEPDHYPPDFMLHRGEEWYLLYMMEYGVEIPGPPEMVPLPGDVVIFKHGRIHSHGAIIVNWPMIIHASIEERCVCLANMGLHPLLNRKKRFFRHRSLEG